MVSENFKSIKYIQVKMQIKHCIINYNKITPEVSLNQERKGKFNNADTTTISI